jgi:cytidylate kinase
MSIITISRGSYSWGKEVAQKVAKQMGYDCISREILLSASEHFNTDEIKLRRAIHDAPSILDRFIQGKERYITYVQATLLKYFREDNIVYHGLAGHFFVRGASHVLKVRIIADMEDRIRHETEREKISAEEAARFIKKDDEQRRKWSQHLYGFDTSDPSLYDLVIHIKKIGVDDAVDIICHTVSKEHFKTTPESQKMMSDLALAAEVKAAVFELNPNIEVAADDGNVRIRAKVHEAHSSTLKDELGETAKSVRGVKEVITEMLPITLYTD